MSLFTQEQWRQLAKEYREAIGYPTRELWMESASGNMIRIPNPDYKKKKVKENMVDVAQR